MNNRATKTRQRIAYHEAGHAVIGDLLGLRSRKVTIIPAGDALGVASHYMLPASISDDRDLTASGRYRLEREVVTLFAGMEAEARLRGRRSWVSAERDRKSAHRLALFLFGSGGRDMDAYVRYTRIHAQVLLSRPLVWAKVEALATALMEKKRLTGREARHVIRPTRRQRMGPCRAEARGNTSVLPQ